MFPHPLFSTFPREVLALTRTNEYGFKIPNRSVVLSRKELNLFTKKYSGVQDPYVGSFVYTGEGDRTSVDKLPFDFDDEHKKYASILAKWLYEHKIGYIVVGTHFDRYHIYIPIYPQKMSGLELQEAQLSILEQAGIYKKVENDSGTYYQPMTDMHIVGDLRRVMRMPNTPRLPKHEGGEVICYCTYLPQKFYEMSKTEIYTMLKGPNPMESPHFFPKPLFEIIKPLTMQFRNPIKILLGDKELNLDFTPNDPYLQFIQSVLRPCIWKSLISPNPPHAIRMAATIDLRDLKFSALEIFDAYSMLGWIDWLPEATDYQIRNIIGNLKYKRFSCGTIRKSGIPCNSDCIYRNNGNSWIPIQV